MSSSPSAKRVFIYGSCVSRDTWECLDRSRYKRVEYVARQSLVSAFSEPGPPAIDLDRLPSAFQRRMLDWDARSALPGLLAEQQRHIDLLLWDIFDERLGLYDRGNGQVLTNSVELISAQQEGTVEGLPDLTPFGTPAHQAAFEQALESWLELLAELDLLERTVLVAPRWATTAIDGTPAPSSFGLAADRANALTFIYLNAIARSPLPVLRPAAELTLADHKHRWGPAPFHYARTTYRALSSLIDTLVADQA